ncbi:unnamed protein product [Cuscuta europaea]|uniref:Uncharacterized protein n=1 Tax=Cuscuta europaea TaxID=41803 RepID=A0A9P0YQA1_CUSEU|nr:unnamed protein product [Cuscuta europaea]
MGRAYPDRSLTGPPGRAGPGRNSTGPWPVPGRATRPESIPTPNLKHFFISLLQFFLNPILNSLLSNSLIFQYIIYLLSNSLLQEVKMKNQNVIIRYNFDKQKDPKTGMWYAICKWCEKKCIMGASSGFRMAIKHMKSCDKAKGSGGAGSSD